MNSGGPYRSMELHDIPPDDELRCATTYYSTPYNPAKYEPLLADEIRAFIASGPDSNQSVIARRWPAVSAALMSTAALTTIRTGETLIINGIQLTSAVNRRAEAEMQAKHVQYGDEAWCYGLALGDMTALMLERGRRVHVVLLNLSVARAALEHVSMPWLADPRVSLHLADDEHTVYAPCAVSPADIRLAPPSIVRDRLLVWLNQPFNDFSLSVREKLMESHRKQNAGRGDPSVRELFGTAVHDRFIVCMSGPSLARYYEWIVCQTATVIAASSALKPLLAAGVRPDFVMAIDALAAINKHFDGLTYADTNGIALVYQDHVFPPLVSSWPHRRYVAHIDTDEPTDLHSGGSVMHSALDLAARMGAKEVTLLGGDLCYRDQSHVAGAANPHSTEGAWRPSAVNGRGETVKTDECLMQYHFTLEQYIAAHPGVRWLRGGKEGMPVNGMEWLDE